MSCSDGKSLVLFDNDGDGNGPEVTGLSAPVAGPYTDTLAGDVVTWEVRQYPVQGNTAHGGWVAAMPA